MKKKIQLLTRTAGTRAHYCCVRQYHYDRKKQEGCPPSLRGFSNIGEECVPHEAPGFLIFMQTSARSCSFLGAHSLTGTRYVIPQHRRCCVLRYQCRIAGGTPAGHATHIFACSNSSTASRPLQELVATTIFDTAVDAMFMTKQSVIVPLWMAFWQNICTPRRRPVLSVAMSSVIICQSRYDFRRRQPIAILVHGIVSWFCAVISSF